MPSTSRDPTEFLRRNGLTQTHRMPNPKLDAGSLRVHNVPLANRQIAPELVLGANGDPPPDRGRTDDWPPPQEVR